MAEKDVCRGERQGGSRIGAPRRTIALVTDRRLIGSAALVAALLVGFLLPLRSHRRTLDASPLSSFPADTAPSRPSVADDDDDDEPRTTGNSAAPGTFIPADPSPTAREKAAPFLVGVPGPSPASSRRPALRAALAASLLTICAAAAVLVSGIAPTSFAIASADSSDIPLPPVIATIVEKPARPDCTVLKCVALTFDDGPDPHSTPALLDILESRGVKANFFVLGSLVQGNEEIILRMQRLGMGVENHTWSHPKLTALSAAAVDDQLARTNAELSRVLGHTPRYMRPPYGAWTPGITPTHGMRPVLWEVDPLDWLYRDPAVVTRNVLTAAEAGDVILLHDIHQTSVNAVPTIIDGLDERGFTFVLLDDIFAARPDCPVERYCVPQIPYASPSATTTAPVTVAPVPPAA